MTSPSRRVRVGAALHAALAACALLLTSCVGHIVHEGIYEDAGTRVVLRGERKGGAFVDRGYAQPVEIPAERLALMLSHVGFRRDGKNEDQPAVARKQLQSAAKGLAAGLAQAGAGQSLVLTTEWSERELLLVGRSFVTSFTAHAEDGALVLRFARVAFEIPKPRPLDPSALETDVKLRGRLLPGPAMTKTDARTLRIEWQAAVFDPKGGS